MSPWRDERIWQKASNIAVKIGFLFAVTCFSKAVSATHMKSKNNLAPLTAPVPWPQ